MKQSPEYFAVSRHSRLPHSCRFNLGTNQLLLCSWFALSPFVVELEEGEADFGLWKCVFVTLCMAEADTALAPRAGVRRVHPSPLVLQSP